MNINFNEQNAYYITSNLEDIIISNEYYINIKKIKMIMKKILKIYYRVYIGNC